MKVQELIEILKRQDPESEVVVSQPTHDHWGTIAVRDLKRVENDTVVWSDYHEKYVLDKESDDDEDRPDRHVLVLK